jgi:hypothetical protein
MARDAPPNSVGNQNPAETFVNTILSEDPIDRRRRLSPACPAAIKLYSIAVAAFSSRENFRMVFGISLDPWCKLSDCPSTGIQRNFLLLSCFRPFLKNIIRMLVRLALWFGAATRATAPSSLVVIRAE